MFELDAFVSPPTLDALLNATHMYVCECMSPGGLVRGYHLAYMLERIATLIYNTTAMRL